MKTPWNDFFTLPDPDYRPKGARDPLGFQAIWQHQGREIFPYISTVSKDLTDFQVLAWANFFHHQQPEKKFFPFFMKFEQAMAYARYRLDPSRGFNGIDAVRKRLGASTRVSISATAKDGIMSNQRTYAIWGKYSRPFRDIKISEDQDFVPVLQDRLQSISGMKDIERLVKKLLEKERLTVDATELDILQPLLKPSKRERAFYDRRILQVEQNSRGHQNRIYEVFSSAGLPKIITLGSLLTHLRKHIPASEGSLRHTLDDLEATERLLRPYDMIFRHLQTRPRWLRRELESDARIRRTRKTMKYAFHDESDSDKVRNRMVHDLELPIWPFVGVMVKRNREVSEWRGGKPWMSIADNVLEVNYADGQEDLDDAKAPELGYDYFFGAYTGLFQQIRT